MVEVAALLAVAQDHALGQPPGAQLRAAVLGQRLARAAGFGGDEAASVWWTSTLRFLGCTGHAYDMAVIFGDEIAMRARSSRRDFSNPFEVLQVMVASAGAGASGVARLRSVAAILVGGKQAAEMNFRTACEVADVLARRLQMDEEVLRALPASFERWNGRGLPAGLRAEAIPVQMRIAQLSQEFEILARVEGVERALEVVKRRRGRAYDPGLTDLQLASGAAWWSEVAGTDPWDAALAAAPPASPLSDEAIMDALLVLADFADLKSPWTGGHSRAVAALAREVGGRPAEMAALVHDLGRVAVPNPIWDKPGPLTRDERDRAESHTLVTDQLLRRVPFTARFAGVASSAHERLDGTGYHRRCAAGQIDTTARLLAAADCYQAMVSDRPHRGALGRDEAARELRAMAGGGTLDVEAVERVLVAAGHRRAGRAQGPGGLTAREAEVLRLVALGLKTKEIAARLVISAKTADHHVQHIYGKLGVSTRGAATLFAIERGVLTSDA